MKSNPQRRCVGCRAMKDKALLIRIAASTEITIDKSQKAPGRGAYICRDADCLRRAHKTKGFERSLERPVPSSIYEQLQMLIQKV